METVNVLVFWGALAERQRLICMALRSAGYRVVVFAWDRSVEGQEPSASEYCHEWHRIHIPSPNWHWTIAFRLAALYSKMSQEVRSYGSAGPTIVTHLALLPVAWRSRGPVVYDAIDIFANDLSLYFGRLSRLARPCLDMLEWLLTRGVAGVTTVDSRGQWLCRRYEQWGIPTHILLNTPSHAEEPTSSEKERARRDYTGRRVVALVGGLFSEKGLFVTLQACSQVIVSHPDVLFILIGALKSPRQDVEERICSLGIGGHVRIVPPMPYRRLLAHLSAASVGLAPYQPERSYTLVGRRNARKLFTYMQAGVPIVAPSFGEIGGVVRDEHCGVLVDTTSPTALAAGVNALLGRRDIAEVMGTRGRTAFLRRYNWEQEQHAFLAFFEMAVYGGQREGRGDTRSSDATDRSRPL